MELMELRPRKVISPTKGNENYINKLRERDNKKLPSDDYIDLSTVTNETEETDTETNMTDLNLNGKIKNVDHPRTKRLKKFSCGYCSRPFVSSIHLGNHVRSHTLEKPFKCDGCSKSFSEEGNLRKHHEAVHTPQRFICETCSKTFTTKPNLKEHTRIHTGEKPYTCSLCKVSKAQWNQLSHHMYVHHGGVRLINCRKTK